MTRRYTLLGVPSAAGTHGPGQELAPSAIRAARLVERLRDRGVDVEDHGDLPVVRFAPDPVNPTMQNVTRVVEVVGIVGRVPMLAADHIVAFWLRLQLRLQFAPVRRSMLSWVPRRDGYLLVGGPWGPT